jgi:hypothetical protein
LILVMLAILVLTTLAAAMVFSARSETLASYNYRIGSQAEFVAQAGIQRALNFLSSSSYATLPPGQVSTGLYYRASKYAANPVDMYFTDESVVNCLAGCTGGAGAVTLGTSTSASRYPPQAVTGGTDVIANWVSAMNNQTIADGRGGTGTFTVTAEMLEYHTVNNAFFGVPASGCGDAMANLGVCRQTYEVWRITSRGRWNSNIGGGGATPAVEMVATIGPLYVPYFGSALYGLCNATLSGSTCTDSYNSSVGSYGGTDTTACVTASTSTTNASFSGAGVGSNGGVTINGAAVTIGGNVTYANQSTDPSCNTGFQGTDSGIGGSVLPGPAIPEPPLPDMTAWGYTPTNATAMDITSPSGSTGGWTRIARVVDIHMGVTVPPVLPAGISACPAGFTAYAVSYRVEEKSGVYAYTGSCAGVDGAGTSDDPYLLGELSASQNQGTTSTINLIAPGNGLTDPTYVAANEIVVGSGGFINMSASAPAMPLTTAAGTYNPRPPANTNTSMVMNVATRVNMGGTSELNYNPASPGTPAPDYLKINIHGTSSTALDLTGQSKLVALVSVPNGGARLSGGGASSKGAFFGAILAKNVVDQGNYSVHYDLAAKTQSGSLFSPRIISVTRPKF